MEYEELTHKIIACAYKVFNTLGFGFLESIYKKGMVIELGQKSMKVEEEKPLKVYYAGQVVGDFYCDLVVEDEIIIELKSVERLNKAHEVQLVNYLNGLKGHWPPHQLRPHRRRHQAQIQETPDRINRIDRILSSSVPQKNPVNPV